jgi:hypothetical protein
VPEADAQEADWLPDTVLHAALEGVEAVLEEGEPVLHALDVSAGDALVDSVELDVMLGVSVGALKV